MFPGVASEPRREPHFCDLVLGHRPTPLTCAVEAAKCSSGGKGIGGSSRDGGDDDGGAVLVKLRAEKSEVETTICLKAKNPL